MLDDKLLPFWKNGGRVGQDNEEGGFQLGVVVWGRGRVPLVRFGETGGGGPPQNPGGCGGITKEPTPGAKQVLKHGKKKKIPGESFLRG